MAVDYSPKDLYLEYLQRQGSILDATLLAQVEGAAATVNWEAPETAADYQATAVLALVEADQAEDLETRRLYLDMALQSLDAAIANGSPSPALAQLAVVQSLLGNLAEAAQISFREVIAAAEWMYSDEQPACQLVYLPREGPGSSGALAAELLPRLLLAPGCQTQRVLLAAEAVCRSQLVLYNPGGERALQLLFQLLPESVSLNRKLGMYKLSNRQLEGMLYLQRAWTKEEDAAGKLRTATALGLAAQTHQSPAQKHRWQQQVQTQQEQLAKVAPVWKLLEPAALPVYLPYDGICLSVEPSLNSIVTRVLLAEGDWFEREMELWRRLLQPGMTVMDVGANSGVYTFSAAKRVGPTGKVVAIEPFPGCTDCLRQTRLVNKFDWVTIHQAAASDQTGEAYLKLYSASELNELTSEPPEDGTSNVQKISRLTLDSLIEQDGLERLDLLKIDAEGHEVEVINGAGQLLKRFSPLIIYENLAGTSGSNRAVAEILLSKGYSLATYMPHSCKLTPINADSSLDGNLNIIAIPLDPPPSLLALGIV